MAGELDGLDVRQDGAALLGRLANALQFYVAWPSDESVTATTLWIAATHAQPAWQHATRLNLTSRVKRCGKSRALDVIEATSYRPMIAVNISPAALVRSIGDDPPTLLLDEVDTIFGKKASDSSEDLRGILNAGHQRNRPYIRCVGVGTAQRAEAFPSFAMAALAGIGRLPDTIADRSIVIRMRRRRPGEDVAPFRIRSDVPWLNRLGEQLGVWVRGNMERLANAQPDMPVTDRAADCWESLVAIADLAGGAWPDAARKTAEVFTAEAERADAGSSMGLRLLADLQTLFTIRAQNGSPMLNADGQPQMYQGLFTDSILSGLWGMSESPWNIYYGRQMSARDLASLLATFDVESKNVRLGSDVRKGYLAADLWDAWQRYV
jgi:hypothetical protein